MQAREEERKKKEREIMRTNKLKEYISKNSEKVFQTGVNLLNHKKGVDIYFTRRYKTDFPEAYVDVSDLSIEFEAALYLLFKKHEKDTPSGFVFVSPYRYEKLKIKDPCFEIPGKETVQKLRVYAVLYSGFCNKHGVCIKIVK